MSDRDLAWGLRTFRFLRADADIVAKIDYGLMGRLHRLFVDRPMFDIPDIIAQKVNEKLDV